MSHFKRFLIILSIYLLAYKVSSSTALDCESNQWQCNNGQCIDEDDACDGVPHCSHGSDEIAENCLHRAKYCPDYAFTCAYGACITGDYKCNGRRDCVDNSDETEILCSDASIDQILSDNCSTTSHLRCKSGECIKLESICDGPADCADHSDETVELCSTFFCPDYAFRCGYGGCIAGNSKCDKIFDCYDHSDESPKLCNYTDDQVVYIPTNIPTVLRPQACSIPDNRKHLFAVDALTNKTFKLGELIPSGTHVLYRCEEKWKLDGVMQSVCVHDKWSNEVPICAKHCSYAHLVRGISTSTACFYQNSSVSCYEPQHFGAVAKICCMPGYTLPAGTQNSTHEIICESDGDWNYTKFHCEPECGQVSGDSKTTWEVSIYQRSDIYITQFRRRCSGIIVSPKIVLSVASCFSTLDIADTYNTIGYNIVPGNHQKTYTQNMDIGALAHNVSQIVLPTEWYNNKETSFIAILVLVNYFKFDNVNVRPLCLRDLQYNNYNKSPYSEYARNYRDNVGSAGTMIDNNARYFLAAIYDNASTLNANYFYKIIKNYVDRYKYLL